MKVEIIGSTKPKYKITKKEAILFSGKAAGICYMPDTIETLFGENEEKTLKRASNTLKMGHHSVFDHVSFNLELSNIPKILAMILNNEGMYTTSEKSARYTKMQVSERESSLYEKWIKIFSEQIEKKYPEIIEKQRIKLAQENARYLVSVFTPSTIMEYTVSFRQLNYIASFFENYIKNEENTEFNKLLKPYLKEFNEQIKDLLVPELNANTKQRKISLFASRNYMEEFGECYSCNYEGTFAELAQAQRHRTLRYNMKIEGEPKFYIPKIIENDEELKSDWLKDINSLKDLFPQGMLVKINERGTVEDFILKCKERLCGCAQLEIMLQTKEILDKYIENTKNTNKYVYEYLLPYERGVRCTFKGWKCASPCIWGAKNSLIRKI